jgi:DNA-directed RNA polymerase specialized sigma24 family protein
LSEVFLDVWRQADRFEGRSSVSTWLIAIAHFKALSARRRRTDQLDETIADAVADTANDTIPQPSASNTGFQHPGEITRDRHELSLARSNLPSALARARANRSLAASSSIRLVRSSIISI